MNTPPIPTLTKSRLAFAPLVTSLVAFASVQMSRADIIVIDPVTGVTVSSELAGGFDRIGDYLVDGSGLSDGQHGTIPDGSMWLSGGTCCGSVEDLDPSITFDLGAVYTISSIHVWNYNESTGGGLTERGVNEVSIEYGTTAALGETVAGITNFTQAPEPVVATYAGEVFDAFPPFTARFIKFDINSSHGGDNAFYGLSEVQFDGVLGTLEDTDDDGLTDDYELAHTDPPSATALDPDADLENDGAGDGLTNLEEFENGTDPNDPDTDGDTLEDGAEIEGAGQRPPTDPTEADSDGDTLSDGVETNTGIDNGPTDTGSNPQLADTDGDTFGDAVEIALGSDPNDPASTPPVTLVGYWPFDSDTDPQPDLSGFANDAAVVAGAIWVDDAERGGVIEFDGNDCYLEAADSESLSLTGDLTIAAWINPTDYTTDGDGAPFRGIVGKSAGPAGNLPASYDLYLLANDGRARLFTGSPDGFGQVTGITVPVVDEWHHLAVTRIGEQVSFYYDGQLDGQGTTASPLLDSDATLHIGNRTDLVTDFLGRMDDVAIFSGGLSPDQITAIMDGDFSEFGAGGGADFAITNVFYDQGAPSVTLTFNSRPGRTYAVDFSTTLTPQGEPGGWQELDDGVESQGAETTFIDEVAAGGTPTLLYRVREL